MRTTRIIFFIGLLASSVVCVQGQSADWYIQIQQSWARASSDFPASAHPGSFKDRMLVIDEWAKENNPSLFKNPNKPYLLAQMVQRELDQETARQTVPASPVQRGSPATSPAVSYPSTQSSTSATVQEIAQSHEPNADRPAIRLGAILIVAIAGAAAYLFYRIVSPKPGVKSATALGRKWAAWTGVYATISVLPVFFRKFDGSSLASWILAIGFSTPIAFVVGWLYGLLKYRQPTTGSHRGNLPDALDVQPITSLPKTGKLIKPPMDNDILTYKLRYYADRGNIELERCVEIAQAANDAIVEQSKGKGLPEVAAAMFRCCGRDEDAAAYFRCAVDSLLQERWGANERDSAVFTVAMNSGYEEILTSVRAGHKDTSYRMPDAENSNVIRPNVKPATQAPMNNTEFEVEIPKGKELENGYVEMHHNTQYSLTLKNHRNVRCDSEVVIDGIHVGTWRIEKNGEVRIERPVHDTGHFTFFAVGTEEARIAGIVKSPENGLVSVTFTPEITRDPHVLYAAPPADCAQGATGLTGESKQRFVDADDIEHDTERAFTIHRRLVSARPDIRPLAPRSTPIPPPLD